MGLDEKAIEAVRRSLLTSYVSPSHSGCDTKAKFAAVDFEITKEEGLRMPRLPAAQGESAGEAVVQALSGWLFQPGSRKGKPAEASGTLQMECRPDSDDDGAERGSFSQIVNIGRTGGTEVSSPKLVYKTQPLYSEEARRARLSGACFPFCSN